MPRRSFAGCLCGRLWVLYPKALFRMRRRRCPPVRSRRGTTGMPRLIQGRVHESGHRIHRKTSNPVRFQFGIEGISFGFFVRPSIRGSPLFVLGPVIRIIGPVFPLAQQGPEIGKRSVCGVRRLFAALRCVLTR